MKTLGFLIMFIVAGMLLVAAPLLGIILLIIALLMLREMW